MKKIKVSEATKAQLNYVVSQLEGVDHDTAILNITVGDDNGWHLDYAGDWAQGGPIIEREGVAIFKGTVLVSGTDWAACQSGKHSWIDTSTYDEITGPTPLVAAMRCFVAAKLGEEPEVPEELV